MSDTCYVPFIGWMGFFSLAVMVLGASFIQIFSIQRAEWWYQHLLPLGATGRYPWYYSAPFPQAFFKEKLIKKRICKKELSEYINFQLEILKIMNK